MPQLGRRTKAFSRLLASFRDGFDREWNDQSFNGHLVLDQFLPAEEGNAVRLRDWLCDALSPMAHRDPRRIALTERVRIELEGQARLAKDSKAAADAIDLAVRLRVRRPGAAMSAALYPNWFVPAWSAGTIMAGV